MKLNQENNIISSGGFTSQNFSMAMTPHAFRLISDGLYTDKPGAVIRELVSNAYDAQERAGVKKPVKITLPTEFNPMLSIRDFGTGITPDVMDQVYTQYFTSDKTDGNTEIGGFGLGAKTPFSYADTFSVRTVVNGKFWSYAMLFPQNQLPQYSLLETGDTDELNGTEIIIPSKEGSAREFMPSITKYCRRFDPLPEIVNGDQLIPVEHLLETPAWAIRKGDDAGPQAVVGPISYPIVLKDILQELPANLFRYTSLLSFDLKLDIGEIDLAVSREQLQLTDRTLDVLRKRLISAGVEMYDVLQDKMDDTNNTDFINDYSTEMRRGSRHEQFASFLNYGKRAIDPTWEDTKMPRPGHTWLKPPYGVNWEGQIISTQKVTDEDERTAGNALMYSSYTIQDGLAYKHVDANDNVAFDGTINIRRLEADVLPDTTWIVMETEHSRKDAARRMQAKLVDDNQNGAGIAYQETGPFIALTQKELDILQEKMFTDEANLTIVYEKDLPKAYPTELPKYKPKRVRNYVNTGMKRNDDAFDVIKMSKYGEQQTVTLMPSRDKDCSFFYLVTQGNKLVILNPDGSETESTWIKKSDLTPIGIEEWAAAQPDEWKNAQMWGKPAVALIPKTHEKKLKKLFPKATDLRKVMQARAKLLDKNNKAWKNAVHNQQLKKVKELATSARIPEAIDRINGIAEETKVKGLLTAAARKTQRLLDKLEKLRDDKNITETLELINKSNRKMLSLAIDSAAADRTEASLSEDAFTGNTIVAGMIRDLLESAAPLLFMRQLLTGESMHDAVYLARRLTRGFTDPKTGNYLTPTVINEGAYKHFMHALLK